MRESGIGDMYPIPLIRKIQNICILYTNCCSISWNREKLEVLSRKKIYRDAYKYSLINIHRSIVDYCCHLC